MAVALGSNLGDRLGNLRHAMGALAELGTVQALSSLYETAPVGGPEQGSFLNAVTVLSTELDPERLLSELLRIERGAGRERVERWGPRTLDLDLIAAADESGDRIHLERDDLQVPHPRAHMRRFVLDPLVEVWPQAPLAGGVPAREFLASVGDQQVEKLGGDWARPRRSEAQIFLAGQLLLAAGYGVLLWQTGRRPIRADLLTVAGGALTAVGAAVATWAVGSLGDAVSPYPEPRPRTDLVQRGPYRLVRHPVYSGLVVSAVGLAMAARSRPGLVGSAAIGVFFSLKARYEESRLRLAVPGYAAYQRRVRGRLIPWTIGPT